VLISHDPRLIELTADRLLLVANGHVTEFDGDMADYKALLMQGAAQARRTNRNDRKKSKQERRADSEQRVQLAPLRRQSADAERQVETLTHRKTQLESELADPQIYGGPADAITTRRRALADLERDLAIAEAAWLTAQEALERAE
jgi:ATP-binding cassette subfamily F protein 3